MDPKDLRRAAAAMDARMRQISQAQTTNAELLSRMAVFLPDLRQIWRQATSKQLELLCEAYPQFARYAAIVEKAYIPSAERNASDHPLPRLSILAAEADRLEQELSAWLEKEKVEGWRHDAARVILGAQEWIKSLQRFHSEELTDDGRGRLVHMLLDRKALTLEELVRRLRGGRRPTGSKSKAKLRA